jgi:nondiscriminating glutamyl-tRNA synthetase
MTRSARVRFAPSPSGHLHVGGARTALFNYLFAKQRGGSFVLRVEDTDVTRSTKESEEAVLEDLRWLGLDWDEGPDVGGDFGPYRQSERLSIYRECADSLLSEGKAFLCYCTDEGLAAKRKAAHEEGRIPQYDGTCRHLADGERRRLEAEGRRPVVRLLAPTRDVEVTDLVRGVVTFRKEMLGDFIIMRSDGRPTYNFAVVVDDALMKITHVIRAEEHLPNTMRQVLLYETLGFELPSFAHVSLIVDKDRSKLSKRRGATSVAEFREQGYLPGGLVNYLALLGWAPPAGEELMSREQLVESFDLGRVSASAAAFDEDKLDWVNAHHIRAEPLEAVTALARPFLDAAGVVGVDDRLLEASVGLVRGGVSRLADLPGALAFLDDARNVDEEAASLLDTEAGAAVVRSLLEAIESDGAEIEAGSFKRLLSEVGKSLGLKGKALFMPVRAALTGTTHGPALGEMAELLGRERVKRRLGEALTD